MEHIWKSDVSFLLKTKSIYAFKGRQRVDSGSWGRGFDSSRGRAHGPGVVGVVSVGVDPALHPSQGGR